MLNDPATRLLPPARDAAHAALQAAGDAAAALDVLAARDHATALEEAARARRAGLRVEAVDLALAAILERLRDGAPREDLKDLTRVVVALDPDLARQGGGGAGAVAVVEVTFRDERPTPG